MKSYLSSLFAALLLAARCTVAAAEHKVLVVMSYEEDNHWVREIREGIDGELKPAADITYFYMNTEG